MQHRACHAPGVAIQYAEAASSRVRRVSYGRQLFTVVNFEKRMSEPLDDQVKLKLARREASILRSRETIVMTTSDDRWCAATATTAASQALQDNAALLFAHTCVNPKVLSPEAAEFMLAVAESHTTLSPAEVEVASHVDVVLRGVHPASFQPVLLTCTTTLFATPISHCHVDNAKRRGELWKRAVGPAFVVVPVVAGYALSVEISALATRMGVVSCDISKC